MNEAAQIAEVQRLVAAGQVGAAFDRLEQLAGAPQPGPRLLATFGWFLADHAPARPHPAVEQALVRALGETWVRPETLAVPACHCLAGKWPGALEGIATPSGLIADPLLLALLRATPAATPEFECLLMRLRAMALSDAVQGHDVAPLLTFLTALAIRGWHSGYALPVQFGEVEAGAVARLQPRSLAQLALLGCYYSINEAMLAPHAAHPLGADLLQIAEGAARQRRTAAALTPSTPMDPANEAVAAQYEQHPYPAWAAEPRTPEPLPPGVSHAKPPQRILIAGCGTGQQVVAAAATWPRADILAVDLSRTSLAFAIDRTAGLPNIRFALADLLHVDAFGQVFDLIECVGVLHHLDDPLAGLQALTGVLAPGGLIRIDLYSRAARGRLADVRARYGKPVATDADVRAFRAWALAELDAPEILYSPDFYSIGGCRDLVFHVREHHFDLAEAAALVDAAGLTFLALRPPAAAGRLLAKVPGGADLPGWSAAEAAHPLLFGGMYSLWARAPGPEWTSRRPSPIRPPRKTKR